MSKSAELIARTAGKSNWKIEHTASFGALTIQDIAHALSGLKRGPYLLAMAKYADDFSGLQELEYLAWDAAITLAIKGGWKTETGRELFRKMAGIALTEVIHEHKLYACPTCGGRGSFIAPEHSVKVDCEVCHATGKKRMKEPNKYKELGFDKNKWYRYRRSQYEEVYNVIKEWDDLACLWVSSRIKP